MREQLLCEMTAALAPQVLNNEINPASPTVMRWWMRRGVNPIPAEAQPASWALIEAMQALVFKGRDEALAPPNQPVLPLKAVNLDWSVAKRKTLLKELTGNVDGYQKKSGIEIYRDWAELLAVWQSTAKTSGPKKLKPKRMQVNYDATFEQVCILLNQAYFPAWAAVNQDIYQLISNKQLLKPSNSSGFDALKKIQTKTVDNTAQRVFPEAECTHATKERAGISANLPNHPPVAEHTSKRQQAAMRNTAQEPHS